MTPLRLGCFRNWCHVEKQNGGHRCLLDILFLDSNSKTLLPIDFKLHGVFHLHHRATGYDSFLPTNNKLEVCCWTHHWYWLHNVSSGVCKPRFLTSWIFCHCVGIPADVTESASSQRTGWPHHVREDGAGPWAGSGGHLQVLRLPRNKGSKCQTSPGRWNGSCTSSIVVNVRQN